MHPPSILHGVQSASARPNKRRRLDSIAALDLIYSRIIQANLAILRRKQLDEQRQRRLEKLAALLPFGLGLLLGALCPQLEAIARSYGAAGMTLIFPFVELASRPEIQFDSIMHQLPSIMLFAQFPLEGLVAWCMLKRGLGPMRVAADVVLIHCFGILDLWLLGAGASTILMH
jgi:hypothetical protein